MPAALPLSADAGASGPWQDRLATAGKTDGHGQPQYQRAQNGMPWYWVRALAKVARGGEQTQAVSEPSNIVRFTRPAGVPQALSLPTPRLTGDGGAPLPAAPKLDAPVAVRLGPVAFPDGVLLQAEDGAELGFFVYRFARPGIEEMWDAAGKRWRPAVTDASALAALKPSPLAFKAGEPEPWQGVLAAKGQKDGAGNDCFVEATAGFPCYWLRVWVKASHAEVDYQGLSNASAQLHFTSAASTQRFGVVLAPDPKKPDTCTQARVQLKNDSMAPAGYIEIRTTSGQEVEITNCDAGGQPLARVTLTADGDISLHPAPGRSVILDGPLAADTISYRSSGAPAGSARKDLY